MLYHGSIFGTKNALEAVCLNYRQYSINKYKISTVSRTPYIRIHNWLNLPLPVNLHSIPVLPSLVPASTNSLRVLGTMSQTPRFLTSRSKTPKFTVFMLVGAHPVHVSITSDSLVLRIDHDAFKVFVGGILAYPVRVEDSETAQSFAGSFFSDGLNSTLEFELVDTLVDWFAVGGTFGGQALAATSADADSEYAETLFSFVSHLPSLGWPSWGLDSVKRRQVPKVPGPDSLDVPHGIGLLLPP